MRFFAFALTLILLSTTARGADIYVDNVRGDDRNLGNSAAFSEGENGPIASIAKALRIARKGDNVILTNTGVPYRESITLQGGNNSGWEFAPLTIEGNGAILDGRAPIPVDGWKHVQGDVYCFAPTYKTYHQLYLDDRPAKRVEVEDMSQLDTLKPLEWCLTDGMIFFRTEKDRGPGCYRLSYTARRTGITLYEVRNVKILDLTVQGFQLDGINVHSNCYKIELGAITSRGNGRSGVSVGGASRATISKSLLGDNGAAQLRGEGFSKTTVIDSTLLENTAPATFRDDAKITIDGQEVTDAPAAETAQALRLFPQPDAPASPLRR
ncbi:right-handed parallel beta-helix repeat-containing protein [Bremerella sp. P1]|uniref:right-handed parallel beta-helix repeat-containing protein n=1 Tax=Bremerella sp. P1 TaxID=3026424 RepID=UPI0023687433|nr:right-handed parallel beta-helix repeat-containing protein [Bremerella sp. P1]WDI40739.1 right-handed parallel beta-helix repeat-containing protein [Bremerella sp. P1]